jgi:cell wall assembly regulator SMI1
MRELWHRVESWLATNAPDVLNNLQPGASDEQIQQLEESLGIEVPEDVKQLYRLHNGQAVGTPGFLRGNEFLSLEKIVDDWRGWIEINGEFETEGIYWNPKWLPLAHNGGAYICVDLDSEIGDVGRLIQARHEHIPEIEVVASSLRSWLEKFADELHAGVYEYYEGVYEKGLFTKKDLRWIREQEESHEKKRKTRQILANLYQVLPLNEQEEYQNQGALDLSHARSIIDGLPPEVLNQVIKLHIWSDKRGWEQIIAPVNDGTAATQF